MLIRLEAVSYTHLERIVKAYQQTAAVAKELGVSYRDAAWVNALRKIEKAMLVRGWAWDQPK